MELDSGRDAQPSEYGLVPREFCPHYLVTGGLLGLRPASVSTLGGMHAVALTDLIQFSLGD